MNWKTPTTALILMLTSSIAQAQLKTVDYSDGKQALQGLMATPKKSKANKPGVLILPAWMGIDANAKESAQELEKLGYHAFIADIYGVGNKPENTKQAGERAGFYKKNPLEYQKRIRLAIDELVKQGANPKELAVIGYCFGGTGAIEAARANFPVKGIVSFHGGLAKEPNEKTGLIQPKVLILHGADDPYVPESDIKNFQQEMRDAKADWQMVYYANSVHGFTHKDAGSDNSKGVAYNEKAAKRSWKAMLDFFDEIFK
ncbi:dienelactone hydrolase family protein [Flavobacterium supellecticarium]|nr:dienelactone hydrolase family protein [Flavobacterium supellecticarium]